MSVKKDIVIGQEIAWPRKCTKCGATRNLNLLSTSIKKTDSVNPFLLAVGIRYSKGRRYTLSYPICKAHTTTAQIATAVGGPIGWLVALFAAGYLLYCFDTVTIGSPTPLRINDKIEMAIFALLSIGWIALTFASRKWVPVRMSHWEKPADNWGGDLIRLTFSNEAYAKEFTRANLELHNEKKIKRRPWYDFMHWPKLFFYAALVFLVLTLIATKIH
jgi:hypothetical protein